MSANVKTNVKNQRQVIDYCFSRFQMVINILGFKVRTSFINIFNHVQSPYFV